MKSAKFWDYEAFDFDNWFHAHFDPADIQIKDVAEKKDYIKVYAENYLNELKEAFDAGRRSVLDSDDFDIMCIQADYSVESADKYRALMELSSEDDIGKARLLERARNHLYALEDEYCKLKNREGSK